MDYKHKWDTRLFLIKHTFINITCMMFQIYVICCIINTSHSRKQSQGRTYDLAAALIIIHGCLPSWNPDLIDLIKLMSTLNLIVILSIRYLIDHISQTDQRKLWSEESSNKNSNVKSQVLITSSNTHWEQEF